MLFLATVEVDGEEAEAGEGGGGRLEVGGQRICCCANVCWLTAVKNQPGYSLKHRHITDIDAMCIAQSQPDWLVID